jgi:hypothetical protein
VNGLWVSLALIAGSITAIVWRTRCWWLDRKANRSHVQAIVELELRKAALEGEATAELDRHFALAKHITDPNHPHHQPGGCIACERDLSAAPERVVTAVEQEWLERMYAMPAYEPERGA